MSPGDAPEGSPGRLSVVSTPIGNLRDITLRALDVLRGADVILAEDTRHTRQLCAHHAVDTPLRALHAHSGPEVVQRALRDLAGGAHLALVTDAGTPLVSDPGEDLVALAREAGLQVEVIPGPSAVTAALAVAGIRFDAFRFVGFLPRRGGKRREALHEIATRPEASVLFESPHRLAATLEALAGSLGPERRLAVCRELTKLYEEVVRGSAAELATHFAQGARGELTVVVEGNRAPTEAPGEALVDEAIRDALQQGLSARDAARAVSESLGLKRRDVYARIQHLRADLPESDPGGCETGG